MMLLEGLTVKECESACIQTQACQSINTKAISLKCKLVSKSTENPFDNVSLTARSEWTYRATDYREQNVSIQTTTCVIFGGGGGSVSLSIPCTCRLLEPFNSDLDSLKQWLEGKKLSLNVIKTRAMAIGSRPNIKKISDKSIATSSFDIGDSHIDAAGPGGGVHDLRMDRGLPPGFQKGTLS